MGASEKVGRALAEKGPPSWKRFQAETSLGDAAGFTGPFFLLANCTRLSVLPCFFPETQPQVLWRAVAVPPTASPTGPQVVPLEREGLRWRPQTLL